MITGTVRKLEARIRLTIRGRRNEEREVEAVIDTGYTSRLTLPTAIVAALGLSWKGTSPGVLADGSICLFDVYEGTVIWNGRERRVLADVADADPLVGMMLMHGYELRAQIRAGGKVTIKPLPGWRRG
jgi:clan AA aspartic protease